MISEIVIGLLHIVLNLPCMKGILRCNSRKTDSPFQCVGMGKVSSPTENAIERFRLRWVCFSVEIGFKLLSERGNRVGLLNLIRKGIQKV